MAEPGDQLSDFRFKQLEASVARVERSLAEGIAGLTKQIEGLAFVRQDVWAVEKRSMEEAFESRLRAVKEDLAAVRENLRWVSRALAGVVLSGAGAYILAAVQ